jgi:hypothetical protein
MGCLEQKVPFQMPTVSLKHLLSRNFGNHRNQTMHPNQPIRVAAILAVRTHSEHAACGMQTVAAVCLTVTAALVLRDNETRIPNNRRASLRAVQHRSTRQSAFTKETNAIGKMVLQPRRCRPLKKMATAN